MGRWRRVAQTRRPGRSDLVDGSGPNPARVPPLNCRDDARLPPTLHGQGPEISGVNEDQGIEIDFEKWVWGELQAQDAIRPDTLNFWWEATNKF